MSDKKQVAVAVKDLHKEFILPQSKNSSFKQMAVNIVKKNNKVTQKVLDGVSFEVNKGDFFGIVGRNGSGKSTLLKLIAGVYTPTSGGVELYGGLTPFIELGVGFNPELSGRDNVYLNGALLGFDRKQMGDMYDEIVTFAELEQFMDQKLKNYSSGMQVRLAFSIAIKAKSDILIFDEVLAVGDEAFQRKCIDVFEQYKAEGQTVILVTHDMETVKKFCTRAVLISEGKLIKVGNPNEVADEYSALNQLAIDKGISRRVDKTGIRTYMCDIYGEKRNVFKVGERALINVSWNKHIPDGDTVMLDLYKASGEHITTFKSNNGTTVDGEKVSNDHGIKLWTDLAIMPGSYSIDVSVVSSKNDAKLVVSYETCRFVISNDFSVVKKAWSGLIWVDHEWIQD